jgi:hypothetical protein
MGTEVEEAWKRAGWELAVRPSCFLQVTRKLNIYE